MICTNGSVFSNWTNSDFDKQIRLQAQQTIVLKNLGKQRKGIFALPQVFCYYQRQKVHFSTAFISAGRSQPAANECAHSSVLMDMDGVI